MVGQYLTGEAHERRRKNFKRWIWRCSITNYSYDDALIGISDDNRAVYDYNKMVEWLVKTEGFTEEEAMEWIDYNTIRALPYAGSKAPIIMFPLE